MGAAGSSTAVGVAMGVDSVGDGVDVDVVVVVVVSVALADGEGVRSAASAAGGAMMLRSISSDMENEKNFRELIRERRTGKTSGTSGFDPPRVRRFRHSLHVDQATR